MPTRRDLLALGAGLFGALPAFAADRDAAFEREVAAIQGRVGGTIGVAALDTANQRWLAFNADRRMAMCSVFKLPLAAAVAASVDAGKLRWDQPIRFTRKNLVPYAPVVETHLDAGTLSIRELCAAAVELSDNAAANLLLPLIGGPAGLTAFMRESGDTVTRLDRNEPELNTNLPDDPRDTSSPRALVDSMQRLLLGTRLAAPSREALIEWLSRSRTGLQRIRAGLPPDWRTGDKTGTGRRGAVNDVAIAWPPNRAPVLIAILMSGSPQPTPALGEAHAQVARLVAQRFVG
jgi:beta-lactamase class A